MSVLKEYKGKGFKKRLKSEKKATKDLYEAKDLLAVQKCELLIKRRNEKYQ